MLIQDRIQLIIKVNNEAPSSFADKIGVKRSNLSHVLSGRNNPSLDFLAKIITHYPNVNASWLITGITRDGEFKEAEEKESTSIIIDAKTENRNESGELEKIVFFYEDGSFKSYHPSEL